MFMKVREISQKRSDEKRQISNVEWRLVKKDVIKMRWTIHSHRRKTNNRTERHPECQAIADRRPHVRDPLAMWYLEEILRVYKTLCKFLPTTHHYSLTSLQEKLEYQRLVLPLSRSIWCIRSNLSQLLFPALLSSLAMRILERQLCKMWIYCLAHPIRAAHRTALVSLICKWRSKKSLKIMISTSSSCSFCEGDENNWLYQLDSLIAITRLNRKSQCV